MARRINDVPVTRTGVTPGGGAGVPALARRGRPGCCTECLSLPRSTGLTDSESSRPAPSLCTDPGPAGGPAAPGAARGLAHRCRRCGFSLRRLLWFLLSTACRVRVSAVWWTAAAPALAVAGPLMPAPHAAAAAAAVAGPRLRVSAAPCERRYPLGSDLAVRCGVCGGRVCGSGLASTRSSVESAELEADRGRFHRELFC